MKQNFYRTIFLTSALIFFAVFLRNYAADLYHAEYYFLSKLLNFIRFFLYFGLFVIWGMSIRKRVVQPYLRSQIVTTDFLIILWLVIREIKYRFAFSPLMVRYLWYAYYIPFLMIPMLMFCVSVSLGKTGEYHLPKWIRTFWGITIALSLFVLSNDFHQFVFQFSKNSAIWTEKQYTHGWMYFVIAFWIFLCSFSAFILIWMKSRLPRNRTSLFLPVLPFFTAILYTILYNAGIPVLTKQLGDVGIFFCLIFAGFFEACIFCGLIPTNTCYIPLFQALEDMSIQITDDRCQIHFTGSSTEKISEQDMIAALKNPVLTENGKQIHCMQITGGYAAWMEDISTLLHLKKKLMERREELEERSALLQYQYEKAREHEIIKTKDRLYDLLQTKTQKQMNHIYDMVQHYYTAEAPEEKQNILAKIIVLGTYIKRRRNFILVMDSKDALSGQYLENALQESFYTLKYFGIKGGFLIQTGKNTVSEDIWASAYDLFEDVAEEALEEMPVFVHFIHVRIGVLRSELRVNISIDTEIPKTETLCKKYDGLMINHDADGTEFILSYPIKQHATGVMPDDLVY